jgi:hypothetical protein
MPSVLIAFGAMSCVSGPIACLRRYSVFAGALALDIPSVFCAFDGISGSGCLLFEMGELPMRLDDRHGLSTSMSSVFLALSGSVRTLRS